jgi:uncharacterized protein YggE
MRLVMVGLAGLAAFALSPAALLGQAVPITLAPGEALLKVRGEGEAWSKPDQMTITAGVVTTGRTAREALSENSALANRLIEAVQAKGVPPRDVRTSQLSVRPQFDERDGDRADREDGNARIRGYIARNSLELRLRDLSTAPQIIDGLFSAGANQVEGPAFSMTDPRPARAEARRAAVASALEEANAYAEAMNMRLSRVLRVSQRGDFESEDANTIIVTGSRMGAPPIEPGEIQTRVQVWIDYAMLPK